MELDMVTDMEVDKVDDIGVNMVADIDVDINMEFQIGEIVEHGGWLIGSKLFRPKVYPACASSIRNINLQSLKLCELIFKKSKCHN